MKMKEMTTLWENRDKEMVTFFGVANAYIHDFYEDELMREIVEVTAEDIR